MSFERPSVISVEHLQYFRARYGPHEDALPFLGGRPMVSLEERKLATEAEVLRCLIG